MLRDTLAHLWGTVSGSRRRAEQAEAKRRAEEAEAKRRAEEAEAKRRAERAEAKRRAKEAEAKRRAETSSIHDACWSGDLKVVEVLLHGQPKLVTSTNEKGATPLHYAAARGHSDIIEVLLTRKADVNAKDNVGCTPLHNAVCGAVSHYDAISHFSHSGGKKEVVEVLLTRGANINAGDKELDWTPLHHAVSIGSGEMVELLLSHGVNVDPRSSGGHTPLSLATARAGLTAAGSYIYISKLLLARGADVNVKDPDGRKFLTGRHRWQHRLYLDEPRY